MASVPAGLRSFDTAQALCLCGTLSQGQMRERHSGMHRGCRHEAHISCIVTTSNGDMHLLLTQELRVQHRKQPVPPRFGTCAKPGA